MKILKFDKQGNKTEVHLTQAEIEARLLDIENNKVNSIVAEWSVIRQQRNSLLSECDWTVLPDAPLTENEVNAWKIYRQALRDITLQSDPFNIQFPEKPY